MKLLISTLLLIIAFFLNFGELGSQGDSTWRSRSRSPQRNQHSSSKPSQPADQSALKLNAAKTGASGSQIGGSKFRVRDGVPQAFQGPVNTFIIYRGKRIEVLLDPTGTVALRADYPGNVVPTRNFYRYNNFLCRISNIGGVKVVEYIKQDGSLIGVRAPTPTSANVMEPDDTKWFIVYIGKYFRVKQNRYTAEAEAINLIPENVNEVGDEPEKVDIAGFKFLVLRRRDGNISGAALLP